MKHRIAVQVPVERRGLFGRRKIVFEKRTILVDGRTYRRILREQRGESMTEFIDRIEALDAIIDD